MVQWQPTSWITIGDSEFKDGDGYGYDLAFLSALGIFGTIECKETDQEYEFAPAFLTPGGKLELDVEMLRLRLGMRLNDTPLYAFGEYIHVDYQFDGEPGDVGLGSQDEEGFGMHVGADGKLGRKVNLNFEVGYVDVGDAGRGMEMTAAGAPNLTEFFSLRIELPASYMDSDQEVFEDTFGDGIEFGLQYAF